MTRHPRINPKAIYCVLFGVFTPDIALAQTTQQPSRSSTENFESRQTAQERQNLYERYFREICQKQQLCDDTCKQVYRSLDNKSQFAWKCP